MSPDPASPRVDPGPASGRVRSRPRGVDPGHVGPGAKGSPMRAVHAYHVSFLHVSDTRFNPPSPPARAPKPRAAAFVSQLTRRALRFGV